MATCGTCGREILWAVIGSQDRIALDKVSSLKGEGRYALEFSEGRPPRAIPLTADREFPAYPLHSNVCGKPTGTY